MAAKHILITGSVRSGKSKFAEQEAIRLGGETIYIATAEALDEEMSIRIGKHQKYRRTDWRTIEEPVELIPLLQQYAQKGQTIIIDCLTLYLTNLLSLYTKGFSDTEMEENVLKVIRELAEVIAKSKANILIVTNEVGWGIVPESKLGRAFRDLAGQANQIMANICTDVYLLTCGIPMKLKGDGCGEKV